MPEKQFENRELEDKGRLQDDYEQLRSYALTPVKTLSHPIGLDLWGKKGFLSWVDVMLQRGCTEGPAYHTTTKADEPTAPAKLPVSLANIFIEWGITNGRTNDKQSQKGAFVPQCIPLYTPVHPSPSLRKC